MKLHILNSNLSRAGGGIYTVIESLYSSQKFSGSNYSNMVFFGYEDIFSREDSKKLPGKSSVHNPKFKNINKILFSMSLKNDLYNSISKSDILHQHSIWLYHSIVAVRIQRLRKIKKIISVHGMLDCWALKNSNIKKRLALLFFERHNLRSADCIHALCEQEYFDIRKFAPNTPIAIIPNGVNLPVKINQNKNKDIRSLVFLSRIHPKKGLINLIQAWSKIPQNKWKLIIVGPDENNHLEELKNMSKNLQIETQIEFPGPKYGDEKEKLLSTADAFILPSYSEGLPMAVLEAWSYKIPVVMTPQCNLPEGFETNSALKIESNSESVKRGLKTLFSMSDSELEEMGNNGYELVKEKYTWDAVAEKMIQMYDWVSGKVDEPDFIRFN